MIIFQSCSGSGTSHLGGLKLHGTLLKDQYGSFATTFRNNSYIHRLNRTLQSELRALSAYSSLAQRAHQSGLPPERLEESITAHQTAGRELVRLIVANRGIPEERSALSIGLTRRVIGVCSAMPGRLFERATRGTLVTLERQLVGSYDKLINEAPLRDVPVLEALQRRAEEHGEALIR